METVYTQYNVTLMGSPDVRWSKDSIVVCSRVLSGCYPYNATMGSETIDPLAKSMNGRSLYDNNVDAYSYWPESKLTADCRGDD